jgi:hypothetical protein
VPHTAYDWIEIKLYTCGGKLVESGELVDLLLELAEPLLELLE